jgi:hypothetical protein
MNSIVDSIFIDNLHIMFGENYLMNTVNTIFRDMAPEYRAIMNQRLYFEINNNNPSPMAERKRELMLDYLGKLLEEFFHKVRNNIVTGGGVNKMEQVKNYIRQKVSNIKPKFYTS